MNVAEASGLGADDGVSVVLSSHVLAELERVADYLILLPRGRVQVADQVDDQLASHRIVTGPAAEADRSSSVTTAGPSALAPLDRAWPSNRLDGTHAVKLV